MAYKKYNSSSVLLYTFGTYNSKFYGDFYYDSYRDGNKMYYREKVVLTLKPPSNGSTYYNNKINVQFKVNSATVNTKQIKGTTSTYFSKETTWTSESDWYSFDKTSGTTPASIKIYDTVSSSALNYTYSMDLPIVEFEASSSSLGAITRFSLEKPFSVPVTKKSSSYIDTLTIKCGNEKIKEIENYTDGTEIKLSAFEILSAYKAMGSGNSGTFTLSLTTKNGATTIGTSIKDVTAVAEGTSKIKVDGVWKNGVPLIKKNGAWKKAIAFIKVNGVWKRGNP